jgi:hypothetical protein
MAKRPTKIEHYQTLWPTIQYWVEEEHLVPPELVAQAIRQDPTVLPPESVMLWIAKCIEKKRTQGKYKSGEYDKLFASMRDKKIFEIKLIKKAARRYWELRDNLKLNRKKQSSPETVHQVVEEYNLDADQKEALHGVIKRARKYAFK